jgi:hypothetical protein
MKIFGVIFVAIVFLFVLFLVFLEYDSKYKGNPKAFLKKLIQYILFYLGLALAGFILYEFVPRILGKIIENIF